MITILLGIVLFIITSCKNADNNEVLIHLEGHYTRYVELQEKIPYNVIDVELIYTDEDILIEEGDLIFEGVVIDDKEIGLEEYINGKLVNTYNYGVYTLKISRIYYSKNSSIKSGDIITVGNSSCANSWYQGTIKMEKDHEYILLTRQTIDTDTIKFSEYFGFAILHPWEATISIENGYYIFDEVFKSLISDQVEEKIRKDGSFKTKTYKKGKEFENEFKDLISKKKEGI